MANNSINEQQPVNLIQNSRSSISPKETYQISRGNQIILDAHLKLAEINEFPKKRFIVGSDEKMYCSYLHFTNSVDTILNKDQKIQLNCILCPAIFHVAPGVARNVKRHLEYDCSNKALVKNWMKLYNKNKGVIKKPVDENIFKLVKFFVV